MRKAAACRAGRGRALSAGLRFRAAAGALAVLFARSHGHAEEIHRAMLGRGFRGHFRPLAARPFTGAHALFLDGGLLRGASATARLGGGSLSAAAHRRARTSFPL